MRLRFIRKYNVSYIYTILKCLIYAYFKRRRLAAADRHGFPLKVYMYIRIYTMFSVEAVWCGVYFTSSSNRKVEVEKVEKKYIEE